MFNETCNKTGSLKLDRESQVQSVGGAGEWTLQTFDKLLKSKHEFLGGWVSERRLSESDAALLPPAVCLNVTYGSGSSTSFFLRSNWSFDILLKTSQRREQQETIVRKSMERCVYVCQMHCTFISEIFIQSSNSQTKQEVLSSVKQNNKKKSSIKQNRF